MVSTEYYNFKETDALDFSSRMGIRTKFCGRELAFTECPYCHGGDRKDKYTFSISLNSGQYQCKRSSCGASGNMLTLAKDFNFSLGQDVDNYYRTPAAKVYKKYPKVEHKPAPDCIAEFLTKRGLSKETADKYHLTVQKGHENVLAFLFTDEDGSVICVKYRKMDYDRSRDSSKEWFDKNNKPVLFGMEQCDPEASKTIIITEGQLDSLSVAECGIPNAVSVPNGCNGFTWIPHCWDFMHKFEEIVVFGDNEGGKITLAEEITKRFSRWTVKIVRPEDYRGQKDANDILRNCGKEAVVNAVNNAERVKSARIVSMADVEAVDLDRIEAFRTGFPTVDKTLGHGIPFGTLTIVTGKRGDGKSTFVSQIYAEALNQNYGCFMYSGELPNYMVKGWLDRQLSGVRSIPNSTIDKINNWYRDRSFMFDNTMVDDEVCDVEDLITEAILKYDCRVIVIDNLMTAMSGTSSDNVFYKQGEFSRHLARLSKKYNVSIILVAHPKKGGFVEDNDTISGSSDIANAADIIMSYQRVKKEDSDEFREVFINKNRYNNGRLLKNCKVKYSTESMRIVEDGDTFAKDYGWKNCDDFEDVDNLAELPFEE